MLQEVIYSDKESPDQGGFNDPPVGLEEITEKEFARSNFFAYLPRLIEYRQAHMKDSETLFLRIFWINDSATPCADGYAMCNDFKADKVRYFRVGCNHQYVECSHERVKEKGIRHFGNCWHVTECTKCGHIYSYDSSG